MIAENIVSLHTLSGSGTTSELYNQGKMKVLRRKTPHLVNVAEVFIDPNAFRLTSNIAALPPSAVSARQHIMRDRFVQVRYLIVWST